MKPQIEVSQGNPLDVSELVALCGRSWDPGQILSMVQTGLRRHYYQFGHKPFELVFSPTTGYTIRANAVIGKMGLEAFDLILKPKFEGINLGKCLAMASYADLEGVSLNSNALTESKISPKDNYSTVDYLSFGLVDSCLEILNNGLARTFEEVYGPASKLRGLVDFQRTAAEGRTFLNAITGNLEANYSILPNQLLKLALVTVHEHSRFESIRQMSGVLLSELKNVSEISSLQSIETLAHAFNLPRPDYERGLLFAHAIISGGGFDPEDGPSLNTPSFTVNLDKVFEAYVSKRIIDLLDPGRFVVHGQPEHAHSAVPDLDPKKIVPDIVVHRLSSDQAIILDTKNKYTGTEDGGKVKISNQDIYQLYYYCKTLGVRFCILVYPHTSPPFQFRLKGSEGKAAYAKKEAADMEYLRTKQRIEILGKEGIELFYYHVDLSGTLQNSDKSIASLCQIISNFL